jgi:hypothetical protein
VEALDLPQSLLELSALLAGAVFVGLVARRAHIPVTVVLAVGGFLVGSLGGRLEVVELLRGEGFEQALVNLFLPILIFAAAFSLSTREFMRNIVAIVALATVALVIAAGFALMTRTMFQTRPARFTAASYCVLRRPVASSSGTCEIQATDIPPRLIGRRAVRRRPDADEYLPSRRTAKPTCCCNYLHWR